jgi:histidinol dehydrogenase
MDVLDWLTLSADARMNALRRPAQAQRPEVASAVAGIVRRVQREGDAAIRQFTREFDGVDLDDLRVSPRELQAARAQLAASDIAALERAIANVTRFHEAQQLAPLSVETSPGVVCERIVRPIESVGLYVPAGSAPLPSAVIMLAVPARIAGCARRALVSPPAKDGGLNAAVLVAAELCGVSEIYKVGGAQAIAALAYGTGSIPKVCKILGPGNAWVTAAKQQVASDPGGAAIDMPAGPSEVLVIADASADAAFVAADLLAQAEHDVLSQAILITNDRHLAERVVAEVARQQSRLSRRAILAESIKASRAIVVPDLATAVEISNDYAPEHLLIQTQHARSLLPQVRSAGSVFLGRWSPEPMGDYCSGTNHVLPTFGYARAYSGVSLAEFQKRITVQELSADGLADLGPTAVTLARLEGLDAHAAAVEVRLTALRQL